MRRMADDKNEQNDDPFRGHLTMDELQALMSGEKTVDRFLRIVIISLKTRQRIL